MTGEPPAADESGNESPAGGKRSRKKNPAASSISPTDRRQLKAAIAAGVRLVGARAHATLARDELEQASGIWLTDEQDQEGLADPLSSLIARRGGPGMVNPDLADALAAMIALAAYLSKQLDIKAKVRAYRRASGLEVPPTGDEPPPPAAAAAPAAA